MLKHPDIDDLVEEFRLVTSAIALIGKKHSDPAEMPKIESQRAEHPLLKGQTDMRACRAALNKRREELDKEIAAKAGKIRQQQAEEASLTAMAASQESFGELSAEELDAAIAAAQAEAAAKDAQLRTLRREAARRAAEIRAEKEIAKLSPTAKAKLAKTLKLAATPTTTKVNG